jgi:hypothetical protein
MGRFVASGAVLAGFASRASFASFVLANAFLPEKQPLQPLLV